MGIDAIEVSGGVPAAGGKSAARSVSGPEEEAYFLEQAQAIKKAVDCPVIAVGGFRSRSKVEEALEHVDAVALSRPFIRQPDLTNLWREGNADTSECESCNRCFRAIMKDGLRCGAKDA
jgi:2,4-dienoyl-CoA reductase-like NADH-dependent reductase (Old Yellow Enzyme family)